jgi:hypothetical protein
VDNHTAVAEFVGGSNGHRNMAEPRVKAGLWVKMALRMGDLDGRSGAVLRKGDPDSGGVLVVLRSREGLSVLSQIRAADGSAAWMRGTGALPVDEVAADAYVARQLKYDPDIWVLEFDAPDLLPPFEAKIAD